MGIRPRIYFLSANIGVLAWGAWLYPRELGASWALPFLLVCFAIANLSVWLGLRLASGRRPRRRVAALAAQARDAEAERLLGGLDGGQLEARDLGHGGNSVNQAGSLGRAAGAGDGVELQRHGADDAAGKQLHRCPPGLGPQNCVDTPLLPLVAPNGRLESWLRSPAAPGLLELRRPGASARSAQGASELPRFDSTSRSPFTSSISSATRCFSSRFSSSSPRSRLASCTPRRGGRAVGTEGQGSVLSDGVWSRVDTCYNGTGEESFVSYPYTSAGGIGAAVCNEPGDSFQFDALGQPTVTTHSDGTTFLTTYAGRATET